MSTYYISLKSLEMLLKIMKKHIGVQKTQEILEEFREEYKKERNKN